MRIDQAVWHGGWFVVAAVAAVVSSFGDAESNVGGALAVASLPGAAGIVLRWRAGPVIRSGLLGLWAVSAVTAVVLSGGLTGPLVSWLLMPLVAASVLGGANPLARGAVLAAISAGAVGLVEAGGLSPADSHIHPWIALFAVASAGAAVAEALLLVKTSEARQRARLARERRVAERFLAAQPCLVLSLSADGAIIHSAGPVFEPLPAHALAGPFNGLSEESAALDRALRTALSEGRAEVGFAPRGAPGGWIVAVLYQTDGGVIASLRDASDGRAREAALEQAANDAEALNAGKSRFLANMSHELRTPLNAVVGFSDIMRSQMFGPLSEKYAEYAALIHESGGHLLDLINDVLDLSKVEAQRYELSREPFDAREAVSAALRLVRVQADVAGIRLRGVLPPAALRIDADRRALKQIVLNLLSNALKFTPSGGSVDVALRAEGDDLVIAVVDTGVGISPTDLERLGNPYEQGGEAEQKAMGTGLGLSLVRAFAELHGGKMSVVSVLGDGTTVVVRLPVVLPTRRGEAAPLRVAGAMGDNVIAFNPHR